MTHRFKKYSENKLLEIIKIHNTLLFTSVSVTN